MSQAGTGTRPKPIGEVLLEQKLVTDEQIAQALDVQRQSENRKLLGEVIVELGFCTEAQVVEALADAAGVPFAHINPSLVDPKTMKVLSREFVESNSVLPLFKVDNVLTVAVTELSNVFLVEEIAQLAGSAVQIVAAVKSDIDDTLELYRPEAEGFVIEDILHAHEDGGGASPSAGGVMDAVDVEAMNAESPVVQLVNHLISSAVREGASDIHIEPDDKKLRVRYRVDGTLAEKLNPPHQMQPAIVSRIKIMAGMDISERRLPQDGSISVMVEGNRVDLRVSTLPNAYGEKVVIRIIDTRNALVGLDRLGLSKGVYEEFAHQARSPHGIILVTGPTGSGKSTTLYAVLNEISLPSINICTVEDPVEFQIPGINQFHVHEKIGLTFANVLRSLLRQDPDVIMLGEIRDPETARIAVQAALTGHLVLSTLHTNDSPSAMTRLHNLQVESYLVSASIVAILAQRLIRTICPECRQPAQPSAAARSSAARLGMELDQVFEGRGCTHCNQRGMKGRGGIFEFLVPDDEMRDAIAADAPLGELRTQAERLGMQTLVEDGFDKVRAGVTTVEEVLRATAV
ncbi:MAG: type II/IV secretion system protein [bacterium]|nr:type II/IV secretion system protein [bacterium]